MSRLHSDQFLYPSLPISLQGRGSYSIGKRVSRLTYSNRKAAQNIYELSTAVVGPTHIETVALLLYTLISTYNTNAARSALCQSVTRVPLRPLIPAPLRTRRESNLSGNHLAGSRSASRGSPSQTTVVVVFANLNP